MRWLPLVALLGLLAAGCGDDDFNGDSGTIITVDQTFIVDLTTDLADMASHD
jgi:hypothetical protein